MTVWREAEVEPADCTAAVDCAASRTSSVPSSVRATCRITFVTPCPASAAAQCTSADPSANRRTRAAQKSSNPSEKPMFLKPTAKPVPRRTPSPRVVLPAPPGSRSGSRGSASGCRRLERSGTADHLGSRQRAIDALPGRQGVPGRKGVQEPQVDGIEPERPRELVHLRLGGEARLDGAEPAHRPARWVVGVDDGRGDVRVRNGVGPARKRRGVRAHGGGARGVGATVERDRHLDAHEAALAGRRVPRPRLRRMPVDVARERLLAVVDHLHGAVRVQREERGVDLHRDVLAASERAADAREVHANPLLGQIEARRDLRAVDVEPLRRHVDVDPALAVRHCETGLRAQERLVLDARLVAALRPRPPPRDSGSPWRITIERTTFGRSSSR